MKNNFADLLDKSFCVVRNFLDSNDIETIKKDFDIIKGDKFLNPNFNILPVGKKIDLALVLEKIKNISQEITDSIDIRTDYSSTPVYFSIAHGVNFGYHQDHESWFLYGNHEHYLNIWVPIIKPSTQLTNVIVLNFKKLIEDHPELSFLKNYGATNFEGGRNSYIQDDNTGQRINLDFDLDSYAECPELEAGDALIMRGDAIHKTQDTLTDRVAISARRLLTTSTIHKSHFDLTSPVKKHIVENNPHMYQKIINNFSSKDTCTVADILRVMQE